MWECEVEELRVGDYDQIEEHQNLRSLIEAVSGLWQEAVCLGCWSRSGTEYVRSQFPSQINTNLVASVAEVLNLTVL